MRCEQENRAENEKISAADDGFRKEGLPPPPQSGRERRIVVAAKSIKRARARGVEMSAPNLIERDPEKLGGTPVFAGTRVPIKNLFDYIETGENLETFLDDFPTVTREQALGLLEASRQYLLTTYESAA
jgi:uncharacterized protein (DUF433 family)